MKLKAHYLVKLLHQLSQLFCPLNRLLLHTGCCIKNTFNKASPVLDLFTFSFFYLFCKYLFKITDHIFCIFNKLYTRCFKNSFDEDFKHFLDLFSENTSSIILYFE